MNDEISLNFSFYSYGHDVDSFNVYVNRGCVNEWSKSELPTNDDRVWSIDGNQTSTWLEVQLILSILLEPPFQVCKMTISILQPNYGKGGYYI